LLFGKTVRAFANFAQAADVILKEFAVQHESPQCVSLPCGAILIRVFLLRPSQSPLPSIPARYLSTSFLLTVRSFGPNYVFQLLVTGVLPDMI
jgi:hypothetical protein